MEVETETEPIRPLVQVSYRVTLVAEVDTERGTVRSVMLDTSEAEHEGAEIIGDILGVPITHAMKSDEAKAVIEAAQDIAECRDYWPRIDYC